MSEQEKSVEVYAFESPLNLERSSGLTPVASKAQSTMELWFHKDGSATIEWIATIPPDPEDEDDEGDEYVEHIGLEFDYDVAGKRTLTDYDGVMTLPDQAMDLLEKWGVDCKDMRKSMEG